MVMSEAITAEVETMLAIPGAVPPAESGALLLEEETDGFIDGGHEIVWETAGELSEETAGEATAAEIAEGSEAEAADTPAGEAPEETAGEAVPAETPKE